MKRFFPLALGIAVSVASPGAFAETCQWKDSGGRTVVSDQPPPGNAREVRCTGSGAGAPPAVSNQAAAPKTGAEKDMDFKKRQQEGKEKADKDAKEQQANADKKENCERAQRQLSTLESGQRIAVPDASGERRFLEDNERQAEIDRTRKYVSDSCK